MPGYPGEIWRGDQGPPPPLEVLGAASCGGALVGGYYREPLRGDRGVAQVDPLSPTIFNVVVDVVVRHWESLVAEREEEDIRDNDRDASQTEGMKIQE